MRQIAETGDLGAPNDQFNFAFVEGMVDRMALSYHKYGHMRTARDKGVDLIECMRMRLEEYLRTHNTEHLMDAANFLMMEFTTPQFEDAHYRATDSDESPGISVKPDTPTNVMGSPNRNKVVHANPMPWRDR